MVYILHYGIQIQGSPGLLHENTTCCDLLEANWTATDMWLKKALDRGGLQLLTINL